MMSTLEGISPEIANIWQRILKIARRGVNNFELAPRKRFVVDRTVVDAYINECREKHDRPTIGELAAKMGMSPLTLTRTFRESYGERLFSYFHRRRHEEAKRSLLETEDKTSVIGSASGYGSPRNFELRFAREEGLTPGRYRKVKKSSHKNK